MIDEALTDELRGQALAGSAPALEQLLAHLRPLVATRCARVLPHAPDAEEAAQDALLSIAQHLGSFDPARGKFPGWVAVIATNAARSTYRSLRRRAPERATDRLPEDYDPRTTSVIAGSRLDLLDALEQLEAEHPNWVQPFIMRDLGSVPYQQIADTLDLPIGTVKGIIHRARGYVRERIT